MHRTARILSRSLVAVSCLLGMHSAQANNISTTNGTLMGNTGSQVNVVFDIAWQNSWRIDPDRWDAAWVFVKFRNATTGLWEHARLGDDAEHLPGTGTPATISTGLLTPGTPFNAASNWGVGVFIHRSIAGTGTFAASGVALRWNYGQNAVTYTDIADVKVYAIEMVRIPEGPFYVGSGGTEPGTFTDGAWGSGPSIPFLITSENALNIAPSAGSLWGTSSSGNSSIGGSGTLPAAFPKGYKAFYMMKHEATAGQYTDFLNTLTRTQQNTRTATDISPGITIVNNYYVMAGSTNPGSTIRTPIRCDVNVNATAPITFYCDLNNNGVGGEADDGEWLGCILLSWNDIAAYLDWSGLRPMTELEYEKACRGPLLPLANEYAWGTTNVTRAVDFSSPGAIGETLTPAEANANYNQNGFLPLGAVRVGAFATASSTRERAGAGYHGVLELSGNLTEKPVTVGNSTGRAFNGSMGDGGLNATGNADVATWPGTSATGSGFRGGDYLNQLAFLRTSDRTNAVTVSLARGGNSARGVR